MQIKINSEPYYTSKVYGGSYRDSHDEEWEFEIIDNNSKLIIVWLDNEPENLVKIEQEILKIYHG